MTTRETTDGDGVARGAASGGAERAPRRSFLAALLGGAVAVLAAVAASGPWIARARGASRGSGAAGAGATGARVPVPPLRPLTREDLYRDHDLAG